MNFLLSTAYIPPISYFSFFSGKNIILLEGHENYQKQSFRNRCHVLSPQGSLLLTVPIQKSPKSQHLSLGTSMNIQDIKISYDFKWQKLHWMTLQSCYRRSTYFEYYEDSIRLFFEQSYPFLWDLNLAWLQFLLEAYRINSDQVLQLTDYYSSAQNPHWLDFRSDIHPKKPWNLEGEPYPQVFNSKGIFQEDLSILDLLFNQGPEGILYLQRLNERIKTLLGI